MLIVGATMYEEGYHTLYTTHYAPGPPGVLSIALTVFLVVVEV